jgi:hypothetical protein
MQKDEDNSEIFEDSCSFLLPVNWNHSNNLKEKIDSILR